VDDVQKVEGYRVDQQDNHVVHAGTRRSREEAGRRCGRGPTEQNALG
jgi:hypothetical protein